jgi:hypothetical protein
MFEVSPIINSVNADPRVAQVLELIHPMGYPLPDESYVTRELARPNATVEMVVERYFTHMENPPQPAPAPVPQDPAGAVNRVQQMLSDMGFGNHSVVEIQSALERFKGDEGKAVSWLVQKPTSEPAADNVDHIRRRLMEGKFPVPSDETIQETLTRFRDNVEQAFDFLAKNAMSFSVHGPEPTELNSTSQQAPQTEPPKTMDESMMHDGQRPRRAAEKQAPGPASGPQKETTAKTNGSGSQTQKGATEASDKKRTAARKVHGKSTDAKPPPHQSTVPTMGHRPGRPDLVANPPSDSPSSSSASNSQPNSQFSTSPDFGDNCGLPGSQFPPGRHPPSDAPSPLTSESTKPPAHNSPTRTHSFSNSSSTSTFTSHTSSTVSQSPSSSPSTSNSQPNSQFSTSPDFGANCGPPGSQFPPGRHPPSQKSNGDPTFSLPFGQQIVSLRTSQEGMLAA